MATTPGAGEPVAGPWRVESLAGLAGSLLAAAGTPPGRPPVVAVDGRSSSGKTTLARRLGEVVPGACTVHTDDIAWAHSRFGWSGLLVTGVLEPVHRGGPVAYRPPAWDAHGRPGVVVVPAGAAMVIVEGVGAGRREVAHLLDATVWVQADGGEIDRRNTARIAAGEVDAAGCAGWMAEEGPFVARQRTWERACVIVAGTPGLPHDPSTQVVVADPFPPRG
jgi:hypothetical protein